MRHDHCPSAPEVQVKVVDPPPAVGALGFTPTCIYSFTHLLAPLALGYGPDSRRGNMRRTETEEPRKSEVDTQGPKQKESGAGQGGRATPAWGWAAAWVGA